MRTNFIQVFTDITINQKTQDFARDLQIDIPTAIGYLCLFWIWVYQSKDDGDISGITPVIIARVCLYGGDPEKFYNALRGRDGETRFIEVDGDEAHVHDWMEYTGLAIERMRRTRNRNAEYKREQRAKGKGDGKAKGSRSKPKAKDFGSDIPPKRDPNERKNEDEEF